MRKTKKSSKKTSRRPAKKTTSTKSQKKKATVKRKKTVAAKSKTIVEKLKKGLKKLKEKAKRVKATQKKKEMLVSSSVSVIPSRLISEKEEVEISKFTPVQTVTAELEAPTPVDVSLPYRYKDNRIVLLPRDPWWLHTYWDISEKKVEEVMSFMPPQDREKARWILRVYDIEGKDFSKREYNYFFDIDIHFEANNWYINVNNPERSWCVEIGLKTEKEFFPVACSNVVKTPYFGISDIVDEEWIIPDEEYFKILGVYDLGKSSLERRKKLEMIFRKQISSGMFSPGISSLFSLGIKKERERKFFLEVATELILYGRTEPNASLTVNGERIKLNNDGTFSLRYFLPEGNFRFEVEAISQDKEDRIKITPIVERSTE